VSRIGRTGLETVRRHITARNLHARQRGALRGQFVAMTKRTRDGRISLPGVTPPALTRGDQIHDNPRGRRATLILIDGTSSYDWRVWSQRAYPDGAGWLMLDVVPEHQWWAFVYTQQAPTVLNRWPAATVWVEDLRR
jgi:hypothetical protein